MAGSYHAPTAQERQTSEFFKRFIDEKDIEFFIDVITAHKIHEEEYHLYLKNCIGKIPRRNLYRFKHKLCIINEKEINWIQITFQFQKHAGLKICPLRK